MHRRPICFVTCASKVESSGVDYGTRYAETRAVDLRRKLQPYSRVVDIVANGGRASLVDMLGHRPLMAFRMCGRLQNCEEYSGSYGEHETNAEIIHMELING